MAQDTYLPNTEAEQATSNPSWKQMLGFTGQGGGLFELYITNFFLSLFTLGIYSFWGKTNIRKYLWKNTTFLGEPLVYTGTGKELFLGFLIVVPIFFVFAMVMGLLITLHEVLGLLVYVLSIFFLVYYAIFRAYRYRLTRTRWRGIRGNLGGSPAKYALYCMGYTLLGLISFGLLLPWVQAKITGMVMNNVYLGERKVDFFGKAKDIYFAYLLYFIGIALLITAFVFAIQDAIVDIAYGDESALITITTSYLLLFVGMYMLGTLVSVALMRWFYGGLAWGDMFMRSTIQLVPLLKLRLVNMLLVICTLGFGYAWALVRELKLIFSSVEYAGDPDIDSLMQDTKSAPEFGEGLLEALDIDAGF